MVQFAPRPGPRPSQPAIQPPTHPTIGVREWARCRRSVTQCAHTGDEGQDEFAKLAQYMDAVMDNIEAVDNPSDSYAVRTARWAVTKVDSINQWRSQLEKFTNQLIAADGFQTVTGQYQELQDFNEYWRGECAPYGEEDGWPTGEQIQKVFQRQ